MVYSNIAGEIKRGMLECELPGGRLPNRTQLKSCHGATTATIQNAVDLIIRQGLVKAHGRSGTFVREDLERSLTIGVAIQGAGADMDSLFAAIAQAALRLSERKGYKLKFYYGIMEAPEQGDTATLLEDIEGHVLGGLILFWPSKAMFRRFSRPWLPIVCAIEDRFFEECEYVAFCFKSLIDRMLDVCDAQGRRRVALFVNIEMKPEYIDYFQHEASRRGFDVLDGWIQASCLCHRALPWAEKTVSMMMAHGLGKPPDALLVLNEQLASHAAAGVAKAGLRSPEELLLISHCNFPAASLEDSKGYVRVGFDIGAFLEACVGKICWRFRGHALERKVTMLKAVIDGVGSMD